MAFVRKKTIKRKTSRYVVRNTWRRAYADNYDREDVERSYTYYYLVASYRESGKVRQKTIACLGHNPTVTDAIAYDEASLEWHQGYLISLGTRLRGKRWARRATTECEAKIQWLSDRLELLRPYA